MKIRLRLDDEETRSIWNAALRARAEVATWPAWKRGEEGIVTEVPSVRSCNRHADCDHADNRFRHEYPNGRFVRGTLVTRVEHCHDECCEECFGS